MSKSDLTLAPNARTIPTNETAQEMPYAYSKFVRGNAEHQAAQLLSLALGLLQASFLLPRHEWQDPSAIVPRGLKVRLGAIREPYSLPICMSNNQTHSTQFGPGKWDMLPFEMPN
jgi:hypothetical protein